MNKEKYAGLIGNQNAKIYKQKINASLSLRCNSEEKESWQDVAKSNNQSLNQWVIETLNKASKQAKLK